MTTLYNPSSRTGSDLEFINTDTGILVYVDSFRRNQNDSGGSVAAALCFIPGEIYDKSSRSFKKREAADLEETFG